VNDGGMFVSYRREDAAGFAGRLCDSLERLLPGESIFRDVDGLLPGQDFVAAIDSRLRQCRVCLAVIGRGWLNARNADGRRRLDLPDDFVRLELAAALSRPEVLLVPVLVEGAAMPSADELPPEIRGLARRQAVTLRDDTWDSDVARLVGSLERALPGRERTPPAAPRFRLDWRVAVGGIALLVLALIVATLRPDDVSDRGGAAVSSEPVDAPPPEPAATAEPVAAKAPPAGARQLAIPAVSQVGFRGLIFTLMSAQLEPGGSSDTLRLLVRLENDTDGAAAFWDDSFRLLVAGHTLAPDSGLSVVVASRATSEGAVTFSVPSGARRGILRISALESAGEIPLDFSDRAAGLAAAPPSPGARAIVTVISNDSRPLVTHPDLTATLTGIRTRRFANVLRVDLQMRLAPPRAGIASNSLLLRLAMGDDVVAPTRFPSLYVDGGTTVRTSAEFEVPPDTTRVILRAAFGDAQNEVPLTLR
jgi:hypothetical protein